MKTPILKAALSAILLAVTGTCAAQTQTQTQTTAPEIKLDTGLVYARGSYGLPTNTDIFIALVNPTYETDDWRLQASFPYVWLSGPASVVGNAGTAPVSRTEQGIGDASLSVTRKFSPGSSGWNPSIGAKVKFPTADENKGLGTGKTDTSFEADVSKKFGDLTPYATLGYQFLGRSDKYPMKDGFYGTLGFVTLVSDGTVMGLAGNWRQPTISGGTSGAEAMAFVQTKLTATSHLQFFLLHGFTDASPDLAVGITLGLKL